MKYPFPAVPARCVALALAVSLAACSSVEGVLSGDRVDYRNAAVKTRPLEVPPDLTQLARDPRYAPQGGVISAAATPQAPALQPGSAPLSRVAPSVVGNVRVVKQGAQRWLWAPATAASEIRSAAAQAHGHATMFRAGADGAPGVPSFDRQSAAIETITQRLRSEFDPAGIFNPGRMG